MLILLLTTLLTLNPPASAGPAAAPEVVEAEAPARYDEIEIEGFRARIRAGWEREDPTKARRVLAALRTDLAAARAALPGPALDLLASRVTIWISPSLAARVGFSGRGMCFHESEGWLEGAGLGAERAGGIEVCNADDYLQWRAEQPMMVLHELAHAYHQALRPRDEEVRRAFGRAVESGRYRAVGHVLAGPGERRPAYAVTNDWEYFAELSEAYFGRNDFEPFDREALRAFDPDGFAAIEQAWGLASELPPARAADDAGARP